MLGQPLSMLLPRVVGIELVGALPVGSTATDLVLTVAELLRKHGVVGKFVEFYGEGVGRVPLENRATIGNMSPEYGSTCTHLPGRRRDAALPPRDRPPRRSRRARRGVREGTGPLARPGCPARLRRDDLVRPLDGRAVARRPGPAAGPRLAARRARELRAGAARVPPRGRGRARARADRPDADQGRRAFDRVVPCERPARARAERRRVRASARRRRARDRSCSTASTARSPLADGRSFELADGHVVIAAITSCTNTSNPSVMIAAGLLARNAVARGLTVPPWVKTSLAPGSLVVTDYYERAGLMEPLHRLGFDVVGYGCTTCIGNSGPLAPEISEADRPRRPLGRVGVVRATATSRAASIPTAA